MQIPTEKFEKSKKALLKIKHEGKEVTEIAEATRLRREMQKEFLQTFRIEHDKGRIAQTFCHELITPPTSAPTGVWDHLIYGRIGPNSQRQLFLPIRDN
jgi:hypothetical protein